MLKVVAVTLGLLAGHSAQDGVDGLNGPIAGPKLVCFKFSTFELAANERIVSFAGGVHAMAIEVESLAGNIKIAEGDHFAEPPRLGRRVLYRRGTSVHRVDRQPARYALFGPTSFSEGEDRLTLWLSGDALRGNGSDSQVYRRFEVVDPTHRRCDYRFTYGWDAMLGDL